MIHWKPLGGKHKKYLHNSGRKSLSLENNKNNEKLKKKNAMIFKTEMKTPKLVPNLRIASIWRFFK